jgi:predicted secreted protein
VLNGPSAMRVSETRTVYANVGVNVPMEKLRQYVRPENQTAEGVLAVSNEMIAVLSGSGFKIAGRTPEQQSVAEGFPTVWSWDVEAKESGDQELEATLYALIGDKSRASVSTATHTRSA